MRVNAGDGSKQGEVYQMTLQDRLNPDPRHTPDNVVPFTRTERRPAQKWWERAQAGQLVQKDMTGKGAA